MSEKIEIFCVGIDREIFCVRINREILCVGIDREIFCVRIDMVSDHTVQGTLKMVKWKWKSVSDNSEKNYTGVGLDSEMDYRYTGVGLDWFHYTWNAILCEENTKEHINIFYSVNWIQLKHT